MALALDKLSILIVEDTQPMTELLTAMLTTLGVGNILKATNGENGFELFQKEAPDLIITDWHMLPMNGVDLAKKIRRSTLSPNRTVPIIMLTGYSALSRIAISRDIGITEYLTKPFKAEDLIKRISHVIQMPRDYIFCEKFFGPNRRRKKKPDYDGPFRRAEDLQSKVQR